MNKRLIIIIAIAVAVVLVIIGVIVFSSRRSDPPPGPGPNGNGNGNGGVVEDPSSGELVLWGVFDDSTVLQASIREFNREYPNIKVVYVKKEFADYENMLVDSIASGEGPDIFMISNFWLPKHLSKISPAPPEIISAEEVSQSFVPVVTEDFVENSRVYGMPLYMDNLALYYNRKIFNDNNIYEEPSTWDEIITYASILTKKVTGNPFEIERAGIALGTADNISRANDILLTFMMQNSTPMISQDRRFFTFNQFARDPSQNIFYPGTNALDFYTSFADPNKPNYSWSASMPNSIEAFAQEKVAMIFGYSYFGPQIQRINPNLNFTIAPLPQVASARENATIANYWGWTVSRNAKNKQIAWNFVKSFTEPSNLGLYLSSTGKNSPFKSTGSGTGNAFEIQKAYTKTLYKGHAEDFDKAFTDMINDVVKYKQPSQGSVDTAARKCNDILARYSR